MDQKTMAYINLHAILGNIPVLCALVPQAKALIQGQRVSIGFDVKDGPAGTLSFADGACTFCEGVQHCDIRLPFTSCEKFNGMINGTVTPIPTKGFTKIGFLLHTFTKLTDILTHYLKPAPGDLQDEKFFETSTVLMFHLIVSAIAQIGNVDKVGKASAGYIVDGNIRLSVKDGPVAYLRVKNHHLTAVHSAPETCFSYMEFCDIHLARQLFDGKVNAVACVGQGQVRVGGMISQVDNVNRIMDRIMLYLA